jgi:hypothetical protein
MKVLLLTDIPPCKEYTAGLVLDKLCRFFSEGDIVCFTILNKHLNAKLSPDLDWIPIRYCTRPNENGSAILPGKLGVVSSIVLEFYNELIVVPKIVEKAANFAKEYSVDAVWCILQGQTMVQVAQAVAKSVGVPLLVQVWDPLEWWLRAKKVNAWSCARFLRQFADVMKNCNGCFAASSFMAEEYAKKYGVQANYFTPSLDEEMAYLPADSLHSNQELIIAMAGQLYATNEWNAFLIALHQKGWKISGRSVHIILLGNHEHLKLPDWAVSKITKTGWLSQVDTLAACNSADILYCPYWLSTDFELEASLSFPAKLTTYLAAGRPVFFHGPRYASPARFLIEHNAGYICDSHEVEDIGSLLEHIVDDTATYAKTALNGHIIFKQKMTSQVLHDSFCKFLQRI